MKPSSYLSTICFALSFMMLSLPKARAVDVYADLQLVQEWAEKDHSKVRDSQHATQVLLHGNKTAACALIMHGLHESPAYMNGLSQFYFSLGYNVISLRLPGHQEINRQSINKVKAEDWIRAGEEAYQKCLLTAEKVELFGYSTGGTIATYLSLAHPEQTKRLALMAPALFLSQKILFTTLILQYGPFNSSSFCRSPEDTSLICQIFKLSDPQVEPMVKEGLVASPAAGFQVQRLIVLTLERFFEKTTVSGFRKAYHQMIMDIYMQLKVPLVMINSEIDEVVDWRFNQEFYRRYAGGAKRTLLYPTQDRISHIHINKPRGLGFQASPGIYNQYFAEVLNLISSP